MEKILLVIVGIVLTVVLVGIGWIIGFQSKYFTQAYSITIVDKSLTDLAINESLLNDIETGKTEDAKHSLQMKIDVGITEIDTLHNDMDARSLDLSRKIFTRIAHDRTEFPNNYSGDLPKMDSDVEAKIESILKQASESQTNK
jgi:hypothetical protein